MKKQNHRQHKLRMERLLDALIIADLFAVALHVPSVLKGKQP
jgi:hypothetical protein